MSDAQHYANHPHRPTSWLITALLSVCALVLSVLWLLRVPRSVNALALLPCLAVLGLVLMIRRYATRLQDRIIRLEMRVRLAGLGREHEMALLSTWQLVALRFASDAERAALAERAVRENLTPDQIKRAVTNWQPDLLRT